MSSGLQPESDEMQQTGACTVRNGIILLLWILPWLLMILVYLVSPGYMVPFLDYPVARMVLIGLFVWESAGCFLLFRFKHPLVWIAVILFCIMPALLIHLLGPAIWTILIAWGPAFAK